MTHHPQLLADLAPQDYSPVPHDHMLLLGGVGEVVRGHDEVGLDVVLGEIVMPISTIPILHLIVSIQVHQCFWCNVDATNNN